MKEVEAAMAVIKATNSEEERKIEDIGKMEKPQDLSDELFHVLQELKKNMIMLQAHEQRKDAVFVVDLDKKLHVFDYLILIASKLVYEGDEPEKLSIIKVASLIEISAKDKTLVLDSKAVVQYMDGLATAGSTNYRRNVKKRFRLWFRSLLRFYSKKARS
ncbi:hypothetical protein J5N97_008318 [Dioscorea zingiberensis]|uniref:Uncharacterized protein n=1 Tax=Dioscorea zingiberensis TaxID=325984 RepID=A0A9D5DJ46_9LILI|nr:hypothetical protein J5N97_008318 [Dioscorea zingiberensis]